MGLSQECIESLTESSDTLLVLVIKHMENTLICLHSNCGFPARVTCNCSPEPVLLCQEHTFDHIGDLHTLEDLYLPLQGHEKHEFICAQAFLLNIEGTEKTRLLKELSDSTEKLLGELKTLNQRYSKDLQELCKHMTERRAALSELERLGVPTFKKDALSVELRDLKKNNQVITYPEILRRIRTYWEGLEHQGEMKPLSQLIPIRTEMAQEEQQLPQITDKQGLKEFRMHKVEAESWVTEYSTSFTSDGRYYAAGGDDKTVRIWNAANGEVVHSLKGHSGRVTSVSFSPDNESLASGSDDNTIRLWKVSSGQPLKQLEGHSNEVNSVAFSNKGQFIASGSRDETVKLWRTNKWVFQRDLCHSFQGHSNSVFSVSFSHDDKLLASGSADKTIKIWDVPLCTLKATLSSHCDWVLSVCFARNSPILVSGSADKTVKLWNVESEEVLQTFKGHSKWVNSVAFSPDDQFIASGGGDRTVKLRRVATRSLITSLSHHSSLVVSVKFSPDGLLLASRDRSELKLISLS